MAPQKEVMIGVSNYNLITKGQLVSFLKVSALKPDPGSHWLSALNSDPQVTPIECTEP